VANPFMSHVRFKIAVFPIVVKVLEAHAARNDSPKG